MLNIANTRFAVKMLTVALVTFVALANIAHSGSALGQPALQDASGDTGKRTTCDTLTIGGPPGWQPVSYVSTDGQHTGLGIDIIKEYAKQNNIKVKVDIDMPWPRTLDLLRRGEIDVSAGAYYKSERQWIYKYSSAFFTDDIMVFQQANRRFAYSDMADLRGLRGARPHGGSLGDTIDRFTAENLDMVFAPTDENIFDLLIAGHVDYVLLGRYDGVATLKALNLNDYVDVVEPPIARNNVSFLFSRNSPCIKHVERVNLLINKLRDDGIIEKWTKHHLNQTVFRDSGNS